MHLVWQVSPILRCLLKEVLSALEKWAVPCSGGISVAGAGSSPKMYQTNFLVSEVYETNFFFLTSTTYILGEKKSPEKCQKGGTLPTGSAGTTTPLHPSSMLPAERCWFQKWHFSKHFISQLPALCSPTAVPFKTSPLSPCSACALFCWSYFWDTMNLQTQRQHNFTYAATSHIIPDVWKSQILELIVLTFIKGYTAPGSALVIFKAYYKAHEKQEA